MNPETIVNSKSKKYGFRLSTSVKLINGDFLKPEFDVLESMVFNCPEGIRFIKRHASKCDRARIDLMTNLNGKPVKKL